FFNSTYSMSFTSLTKIETSREGGFTVIELIVSIFIMIVITTVITSNQSQYTSQATLKNLANNLSLNLRQAQVYGISVKEVTPNTNQPWTLTGFSSGYGVNFNLNSTGDNNSYILYVDKDPNQNPAVNPNANGLYQNGISCPKDSTSECLDRVYLGTGYIISDLCTVISGVENCNITVLDISFIRPNIEAKIFSNQIATPRNVGCIELSSVDARTMSVVVYTTGQISVRNMTCTEAI
ncbi:MAG: type II secretion system protein, partial [Minisyncoccota bacterium]